MIKYLILNNLVLVDSCEIHFGSSFNVITGETGAGKTALIEAIGLVLGDRADSSLIRKGCERAFVEIACDIDSLPNVKAILEEAGLSCEDDLIIRRELSKEGKNRAFVNCRQVPLPLLQTLGSELIDLIGQHAHQMLRTTEAQRLLVDRFGDLQKELQHFQSAYAEEKKRYNNLEQLKQLALHRERDEDTWRFQLHEIESVDLKVGEEDVIFEKYTRQANSQELTEKLDRISQGLSDAILPQLARFNKLCDPLQTYDRTLPEATSLMHEAHIALSEALRILHSSRNGLESDPRTFQFLEERLSAIAKLKRKYGQNFEEIEAFRQKLHMELSRLENLSEELKTAESSLLQAQDATHQAARALSAERKKAAARLQKALTTQLQMLNMSGAEVSIEITQQARGQTGDDHIQFWLKANQGEHPGLIKEHSSGGELSRLLFAIKIVLAEKNNTPTLIFDEIDANVGGKTATTIGEKLKELGKCRQVICITHFPQVAAKADEHFNVEKIERDGRTFTEIKQLTKLQREQELLRMIGGKQFLKESAQR